MHFRSWIYTCVLGISRDSSLAKVHVIFIMDMKEKVRIAAEVQVMITTFSERKIEEKLTGS